MDRSLLRSSTPALPSILMEDINVLLSNPTVQAQIRTILVHHAGSSPAATAHPARPIQHPTVDAWSKLASSGSQALSPAFLNAIKLSEPITSSPQEDARLLEELSKNERLGVNYCSAFEALHGVNNHSEYAWMRFYITHQKKFDTLIAQKLSSGRSTPANTQAPIASPPRAALHESHTEQSEESHNITPAAVELEVASYKAQSPPSDSDSDWRSARSQVDYDNQERWKSPKRDIHISTRMRGELTDLMLTSAQVNIPDPPARSPSPPLYTISQRNRFTPEDQKFFFAFIQWRLKKDPSLTRNELCELLSEKAPHHSVGSWQSYWRRMTNIADKILLEAQKKLDGPSSDPDTGTGNPDSGQQPRRRGARSRSNTSAYEDASDHSCRDNEDVVLEMLEDDPSTDDDRARMGANGAPYTKADIRMLARTIAKQRGFEEFTYAEKLEVFSNICPQRTGMAWYTAYNHKKPLVDRLIRKYEPKYRIMPTTPLPLPRRRVDSVSRGLSSHAVKRAAPDGEWSDADRRGSSPSKRHKEA